MNIVVCGGRDFSNYIFLKKHLNLVIKILKRYAGEDCEINIVSGMARGADKLGEKFADDHGYEKKLFPAEWDIYGKAAGPMRNRQMLEVASVTVAYWDGLSVGTKDMIEISKKKGIPTIVAGPFEVKAVYNEDKLKDLAMIQ